MQLTVWTYEGPPHIGAMRIANSMERVHLVLHAPQGDTYADLLFTMIERNEKRPPVTYTTFQARDLGSDTASLFKNAVADAYARFQPDVMLVGASCTAELIQDDPGGLAQALKLPCPVIPLELPAYQKKENWGAGETLYQMVRHLCAGNSKRTRPDGASPRCNILGPTSLGFRNRDDVREVETLVRAHGIEINATVPLGANANDIAQLANADFNVVLYPEIAGQAAQWLKRNLDQPATQTQPIGIAGTNAFISEIASLAGVPPRHELVAASRMPWYSKSVDSNYLTGKRVFIFGDGTHALAAGRIARDELGFDVVGLGTYTRELARDVRALAKDLGVAPLITDDYLEVEDAIAAASPELVLGTQMERHTAKRLGIPCAVISAPIHVEDFPARYAPQMGTEGANVIFDTWVHPLTMGLEEHLLALFSDDFEFDDTHPSHLGHGATNKPAPTETGRRTTSDQKNAVTVDGAVDWSNDAESELKKIPFFVRGKARRNTETFAKERGLATITLETLYDAKAHYAR